MMNFICNVSTSPLLLQKKIAARKRAMHMLPRNVTNKRAILKSALWSVFLLASTSTLSWKNSFEYTAARKGISRANIVDAQAIYDMGCGRYGVDRVDLALPATWTYATLLWVATAHLRGYIKATSKNTIIAANIAT